MSIHLQGWLRGVILLIAFVGGVLSFLFANFYHARAAENRSEKGKQIWWAAGSWAVWTDSSYYTPLGWRYHIRSLVASIGLAVAALIGMSVY